MLRSRREEEPGGGGTSGALVGFCASGFVELVELHCIHMLSPLCTRKLKDKAGVNACGGQPSLERAQLRPLARNRSSLLTLSTRAA